MRKEFGVLLLVIATGVPLAAQWLHYPTAGVPRGPDGSPNLSAPAPKTPDGNPDLSGVWGFGNSRNIGRGKPFTSEQGGSFQSIFFDIASGLKDDVPYQPWAAELANKRKADEGKDTPDTRCLPLSLVQKAIMWPRKIAQLPGLVLFLYERNMEFRQIFTDGRPLPEDPNPAWNGYSTGRWVGDTLVVQTAGFRDGTWADFYGSPLTDAVKVTERIRRPTFGQLIDEITVDDPKAYTRPWTVTVDYNLMIDTDLLEYVCLENEKDASHLAGK